MAQVIPGANITCLFADTPPSTNTATLQHNHPGLYGSVGTNTSRQSYNAYTPQQQFYGRRDPHIRDEIILLMDDRVVALRVSPAFVPTRPSLPPAQASSAYPAANYHSIPR